MAAVLTAADGHGHMAQPQNSWADRPATCCAAPRRSEFEARDVTLSGSHVFEVPDGYKLLVRAEAGSEGGLRQSLVALQSALPSWEWWYSQGSRGQVLLDCVRHGEAGGEGSRSAAGVQEGSSDGVAL
jgi:hypothetical protein